MAILEIDPDPKRTILIVDNNETNINILVNLLERFYRLQIALNGRDALSSINKSMPDLIFLATTMPDTDSFEVCSKLKQNVTTRDISIIFITAKSDTDSIVKSFEVGGVDYVTVPFLADDLLAHVKVRMKLQRQRQYLKILVEKQAESLRSAHQKIKHLIKAKKSLDHLKDNFTKTVSHILRSPLTSILGYAEILKNIDYADKKTASYAEIIHSESLKLEKLSDDIIDLSCLVSNREEYEFKTIHLHSVILTAIETLHQIYDIDITSRVRNLSENLKFEGDHKNLSKVFLNLLDNGIKFSTQDASPIEISTERNKDYFSASISNQGMSLPKEELENIFGSFYQFKYPNMEIQGAGIGLAIAKGIVDFHMGKIWAEQSFNRIVFTFSIPYKQKNNLNYL